MRNTHRSTIHTAVMAWRACVLLILLAAARLPAQQTLLASNLPDAPTMQEPAHPQNGAATFPATVSGTVTDVGGALVPGAQVKLLEKGHAEPRVATSDSAGNFTFTGVEPGSYTVEIIAMGLESFLSPAINLRPGEKYELPEIGLPIATASTSVDVFATSTEVAEQELKAETQQRVLGVIPNFYTSFLWNAAPLNTRQKFKLSFRATTDPAVFVTTAIVAGVEQAHNTFPEYGDDAEAYGKRYGAAFGDAFIGRTLGSAVFPSIFHQDPRYFFMGPANSTPKRIKHALLAGLIARGDNGKWQPNYSHVLGNASAGAISTLYHPDTNGPGDLALRNALIGIAGGGFQALIREFVWPHITTRVPKYAKGKPGTAGTAATSTP
jgi:hypothetical protein